MSIYPSMETYEKKAHAVVMKFREMKRKRMEEYLKKHPVCSCGVLIDRDDPEQVNEHKCSACLGYEVGV